MNYAGLRIHMKYSKKIPHDGRNDAKDNWNGNEKKKGSYKKKMKSKTSFFLNDKLKEIEIDKKW